MDGESTELKEASSGIGRLWIAFLMFALYLAISVGSVTHLDLLLENPITLPVLNVQLPSTVFFGIAPPIFLIFHFYYLLQLVLFDEKFNIWNKRLQETLEAAPENERLSIKEMARIQFPNTLVTQAFAAQKLTPDQLSLTQYAIRLVAPTSAIFVPLIIYFQFLITFLPYQNTAITWWHRFVLMLAVVLIAWLSPTLLGKVRLNLIQFFLRFVAMCFVVISPWPIIRVIYYYHIIGADVSIRWILALPSLTLFLALWYLALSYAVLKRGAELSNYLQDLIKYIKKKLPSRLIVNVESIRKIPGNIHNLYIKIIRLRFVTSRGWFFTRWMKRARLHSAGSRIQIRATLDPKNIVIALIALFSWSAPFFGILIFLAASSPDEPYFKPFRYFISPFQSWLFEGRIDPVTGKRDSFFSYSLVLPNIAITANARQGSGDWPQLSLRGRRLEGAVFDHADLRNVDFTGAILNSASFQGAKLQGAKFECGNVQNRQGCVQLRGASFNGAELVAANFSGSDLRGAIFAGANMTGAQIAKANADRANFISAKLHGANFNCAYLAHADFERANLLGASLSGASLDNATFHGADARGVLLVKANQERINFERESDKIPYDVDIHARWNGAVASPSPPDPSKTISTACANYSPSSEDDSDIRQWESFWQRSGVEFIERRFFIHHWDYSGSYGSNYEDASKAEKLAAQRALNRKETMWGSLIYQPESIGEPSWKSAEWREHVARRIDSACSTENAPHVANSIISHYEDLTSVAQGDWFYAEPAATLGPYRFSFAKHLLNSKSCPGAEHIDSRYRRMLEDWANEETEFDLPLPINRPRVAKRSP